MYEAWVKGDQLHFEIFLKEDTIPKSISIELVESIKVLGGEMETMQRFATISTICCNHLQQAVCELLPE